MSTPSRGGGTSSRGRRVIAPRGPGRRSQAERTQRQQDEQVRTHARDAEYAHQLNEQRLAAEKAERAKQRTQAAAAGRRGRGGFMGDGGSSISSGPAPRAASRTAASTAPQERSGPLSDGSVISSEKKKTNPRNWAPSKRGSTGRAKCFGTVKREGEEATSSSANTGSSQKAAPPEVLESDEDDDEESDGSGGPRVDVDYINLISEDEESDSSQTARARFAPVRVDRVPHRDRAPQINPEASSSVVKKQESDTIQLSNIPLSSTNQRGKQRAKDVEIIEVTRPWRGVYQDEQPDRIIKREPGSPPAVGAVSRDRDSSMPDATAPVAPTPRSTTKRRVARAPVFSTDEDKQEWRRHNAELQTMVDELGLTDSKPATDVADTEEANAAQSDERLVDKKQDRVYLFQFPPVVPDLRSKNAMPVDTHLTPSSTTPSNTTKDDKKPQIPHNEEVAVPLSATHNAHPSSTTNTSAPSEPGSSAANHLPKLASGRAGKLKVYKSGKATLDWGGTSLQLNMGTSPFFLQDSVMVRMHPPAPLPAAPSSPSYSSTQQTQAHASGVASSSTAVAESSSAGSARAQSNRQATEVGNGPAAGVVDGEAVEQTVAGEAFAFGQIRGKFIVTPDWDEVLG